MLVPVTIIVDRLMSRYLDERRAILDGALGKDVPQTTDGITSGAGNQGSASTTMNMGQSGTSGMRGGLPMSIPSIVDG